MELVPNRVPEMTAQPGRKATGQIPMPLYNGRITSTFLGQCLAKELKFHHRTHPNLILNKHIPKLLKIREMAMVNMDNIVLIEKTFIGS